MKDSSKFLILIFVGFLYLVSCHESTKKTIGSQVKVTYASLIKLRHVSTQFWLHAHEIRFPRGNIFSVTAYRSDDHGSLWQVLEQYDLPQKTKSYLDPVKCGDNIVLYGSIMDYYLRTQDTTFGLTTQLLPLIHGVQKDQMDHGIVWNVHCVNKQTGDDLHYGDKIRLKHETSGKYVSTDGSSFYTEGNCGRGCEIAGQLQLHAVDNGEDTDDSIFQIIGALSFDQEAINSEKQE